MRCGSRRWPRYRNWKKSGFSAGMMWRIFRCGKIGYIENLEKGLALDKELIYGAALLHDIGRGLEYTQNIPHDQGSQLLAEKILPDCGYTKEEENAILEAISGHRTADTGTRADLAGLLYRADKKSRTCLFCSAQAECKWSTEKKNLTIEV